MIINEIICVNFQSHKNTHLHLSEGVNAIIGDTDSGKSSLFRALIWLFTNRPIMKLEEFQSKWGGDTHVGVKFNEIWVGRVRSKSKNYYYLNEDIEANRLENFKNGPPPDKVVELLNLGDVNFMSQMALPFLLSQSSGAVGRFLNEAAELDVIDRSVSYIAGVIRKEKAEIEGAISLSEEAEKALKGFDWIEGADNELSGLETMSKNVKDYEQKIRVLNNLLDDIDEVESDIEKIQPVLNLANDIKENEKLSLEIREDAERADRLDSLLNEIEDTEIEIENVNEILKYADEAEKLNELIEEAQALNSQSRKLNTILTLIQVDEEKLKEAQIEADDVEREFKISFPKECPLCSWIRE